MRNPTKNEIRYVKRQLQTGAISKRQREDYPIWLFIVEWKSGDGDKFQAAGEKFFPKDLAPKQKAYYRYTAAERELAKRRATKRKQKPPLLTNLDNALWASPSLAWLSPAEPDQTSASMR